MNFFKKKKKEEEEQQKTALAGSMQCKGAFPSLRVRITRGCFLAPVTPHGEDQEDGHPSSLWLSRVGKEGGSPGNETIPGKNGLEPREESELGSNLKSSG